MYRHIAQAFLISVSLAAVAVPLIAGATTTGDVIVSPIEGPQHVSETTVSTGTMRTPAITRGTIRCLTGLAAMT